MKEATDSTLARDLARIAADAVASLCDINGQRFWRSTAHRDQADEGAESTARFPTVSLCCSQALLVLSLNEPQWCSDPVRTVIKDAAQHIPGELTLDDLAKSSLSAADDAPSPFTVAQLLEALVALSALTSKTTQLRTILEAALDHSSEPLRVAEAGPQRHPFFMYHAVRALAESRHALQGQDIVTLIGIREQEFFDALEDEAMHLLADHIVGKTNPAQIVALAFCGAGLAFDRTGDRHGYALAALEAASKGQEMSGCWALGRLVRDKKDTGGHDGIEVEISTYEIAWAMADAIVLMHERYLDTRIRSALPALVDKLRAAARYANASIVTLRDAAAEPRVGWCSDHPYKAPMIESWTSATALRSALSLARLLRIVESDQALRQYSIRQPTDLSWPPWLRWDVFRDSGETDHEARILGYLNEHIVAPILGSPLRLPSGEDNTVSALLFGPPGTAKTTIAKGVADGLGWPVVELNPGVFIERGLELIEATARAVFDDLLCMERAVILFDECDELFRERGPEAESEQMRSISAFVTASMLPKLQHLHDEGRVVFMICTNNFATLDPAVKRRGRIDHVIAVGPPDEAARKRIVASMLKSENSANLWTTRLWTATERFTRSELQYLVREVQSERSRRPDIDLDQFVPKLIETVQPSLNITAAALSLFNEQKRMASHPHLRKGAQ